MGIFRSGHSRRAPELHVRAHEPGVTSKMQGNMLGALFLILLSSLLGGCFPLSTAVSTAGLREQHINVMEQLNQKEHPGIIYVYESPVVPQLSNHGTVGFPYSSIHRSQQKQLIGEFTADTKFREAINKFEGYPVQVELNGQKKTFMLTSEGQYLELRRRYRTGKGYALQSLQLIALPIDLAFTGVALGVTAAFSPLYILGAIINPEP